MKYLVVSDNHGERSILEELKNRWQGEVDYFFHCGDSELPISDSLWETFVVVKGNCDYDTDYLTTQSIQTEADHVFISHGHLYFVNQGLDRLAYAAEEVEATIALYGHTHKLAVEKHGRTIYVNPGSISQPRGQFSHLKTYLVIESTRQETTLTYYNRQHQPVPELTFTFKKEKV